MKTMPKAAEPVPPPLPKVADPIDAARRLRTELAENAPDIGLDGLDASVGKGGRDPSDGFPVLGLLKLHRKNDRIARRGLGSIRAIQLFEPVAQQALAGRKVSHGCQQDTNAAKARRQFVFPTTMIRCERPAANAPSSSASPTAPSLVLSPSST